MPRREGTDLDPTLWENLPEDLIKVVLSKVTFETLVSCRAVCNRWNLLYIPRIVAARTGHTSSKSPVLLYFGNREHAKPVWFNPRPDRFRFDPSNPPLLTWETFRPGSFPFAGRQETVFASEGGLLFFTYSPNGWDGVACITFEGRSISRSILVWNPVTSRGRTIWLPPPLSSDSRDHFALLGAVAKQESGTYKIVVAQFYFGRQYRTMVYDSVAHQWRVLPVAADLDELIPRGVLLRSRRSTRGISYNGNVYWSLWSEFQGEWVFKFDLENEMWSRVGELRPHQFRDCGVTWRNVTISEDDQVGRELLFSFKGYQERSEFQEVGPGPDVISQLGLPERGGIRLFDYLGFKQEDLFVHIIYDRMQEYSADVAYSHNVRIVVQNTLENCYSTYRVSEFYGILVNPEQRELGFGLLNVWAFSPSLTAMA